MRKVLLSLALTIGFFGFLQRTAYAEAPAANDPNSLRVITGSEPEFRQARREADAAFDRSIANLDRTETILWVSLGAAGLAAIAIIIVIERRNRLAKMGAISSGH